MSKFITKRLKAHTQEFVALVSITIITTTAFMIISTTTTMLYYSPSHAPAHVPLHMDKEEHCICSEHNTTQHNTNTTSACAVYIRRMYAVHLTFLLTSLWTPTTHLTSTVCSTSITFSWSVYFPCFIYNLTVSGANTICGFHCNKKATSTK